MDAGEMEVEPVTFGVEDEMEIERPLEMEIEAVGEEAMESGECETLEMEVEVPQLWMQPDNKQTRSTASAQSLSVSVTSMDQDSKPRRTCSRVLLTKIIYSRMLSLGL